MTFRQAPISFDARHKSDPRTQFGALCYRIVGDRPQVLLITSRGSKRWIVPKGWPMPGLRPGESALQEAYEEAGVQGKASDQCLGVYSYSKELPGGLSLPCIVLLFPVQVKTLTTEFPESHERKRKWFSRKKAAARVGEIELARMIRTFDPRQFRR